MPTFLALEQQVQALSDEVGEVKGLLRNYLDITRVSPDVAVATARMIAEHVVRRALEREGLPIRRDLLDNIETLGGLDADAAKRRQGRRPVLPSPIYAALHLLRVYGNTAVHSQSAKLDGLEVHGALAAALRVVAWYFQEYERGPQLKNLYPGQPTPTLGRFSDVPPEANWLVGRGDEVARLLERLRNAHARVTVLVSPGGIGKSLLVSRVAQEAAADGSAGTVLLWFDLSARPTFAEVTARALASLMPDARGPSDADLQLLAPAARTARLVRLLADRPVVVVLDNLESWLDPVSGRAADPAVDGLLTQLISAAHRSRVLVTTRLEPAGCTGAPPAYEAIPLRGLTEPAFVQLLRGQGLTGPDETLRQVWQAFGGNTRLLLFLADVVRRRHGGDLAAALKRQPGLLARTAEPLLRQIWEELPPGGRDVLRTLALLNRPVVDADLSGVFSALFPDATIDPAEEVWQHLAPRDLAVHVREVDGFRVEHPLIGEFAAARWDDPAEAHRTLARYFLSRAGDHGPRDSLTDASLAALLAGFDYALAARDRELAERAILNTPLVCELWWRRGAAARLHEVCEAYGRTFGLPDRPEAPGWLVRRWHGTALRGIDQRQSAVNVHEDCRRAAVERGDRAEECRSLIELSSGYRLLTRLADARAAGLRALSMTETLGLAHERTELLLKLAKIERVAGRLPASAGYAKSGLSAAEDLGRDELAGEAHDALGVLLRNSDPAAAERHLEQGLALVRRAGARLFEANLLGRMGDLLLQYGRWEEAEDYLTRALALRVELGTRSVLDRANLGIVRLVRGRTAEAVDAIRAAFELAIAGELRRELATILGQVGEAYAKRAAFTPATACCQTALELYAAWGMNTFRRERFMRKLQERVAAAGDDWNRIEADVRLRRYELLAETTGVPADRWDDFIRRTAATNTSARADSIC
jgi:tetratricopeptide (TPR) repeat protein